MTRVLLLWVAPDSANLGVRALGEGTEALVRRVAPDAEVHTQNYGRGTAPTNIGVGRTLVKEALLDSAGLRSWVRSFDLVIDTRAGDSFSDIYGFRRLRSMSAMAQFVRACGVPLVLGPQTIGPFERSWGRVLGAWSLRRATRVMARDSASAASAAALGRSVDVLTTDVAFALPQPQPGEPRDVLLNVSGLLWNSDVHGSAQGYRKVVRQVVTGLQERQREPSLFCHVLDSPNPDNDVPVARELGKELGLPVVVPESLEEARSIVKGAKLVIGSRMHACLNSLSVGTPAIPLAYSRKFGPLLDDLGWKRTVELNGSGEPAQRVLDIVDRDDELVAELAEVCARATRLLAVAEASLREFV